MHPMIKPALRRGWRDRQTLQYGVAPAHAVLLGPVDDASAAFLDRLDGTRSMELLRQEAVRAGLPPGAADTLVARLTAAGLLDDAETYRRAAGRPGDGLRADLASLSTVHPEPGGGPARLAARRRARVRVRGAGRVGAAVAALLSAAGVGRVEVLDGGDVEPWDTLPGGIGRGRIGERRDVAARRVVCEAAPWPRRPPPEATRDGDGIALVVVTPRDGLDAYAPDPAAAAAHLRAGAPHLFAGVLEGTGFVGPLVLPGVTACAECLHRARAEREPAWPLVVAQWRSSGRGRAGVPACDAALATMVAGITASYALSFLDGDGLPAAGFRTRWVLPHLSAETERLTPHTDCPCGAASGPGDPPPSAGVPVQSTMAR
ncbi:ThiF family adenylyltransferase [Streptomyces sp. RKND-216]|uniref:ThiF family adenylyltransferase n=1 Tax=Streptomyces sp. RKND-216 TaxID=2562581 RepID=UPI00109E019B|nr:ThiF family adenylyltransferase [Streptomyces sp. RKND-216]THA24619.1 ThiF family adenylyltransferase [Streptomyces sp. RKND-216]